MLGSAIVDNKELGIHLDGVWLGSSVMGPWSMWVHFAHDSPRTMFLQLSRILENGDGQEAVTSERVRGAVYTV